MKHCLPWGEVTGSDSDHYVAKATGDHVPDDVAHISKKQHHDSIQIMAIGGSDRTKCPLIFMEEKKRLIYLKFLCHAMFPWATAT